MFDVARYFSTPLCASPPSCVCCTSNPLSPNPAIPACPCNPFPVSSFPSLPALTTSHFQERGSEEVRAAAACVASGLARGGCAVLWADGAYNFDQAVRACTAALLDDGTTVSSVWRSGRCGKVWAGV